MCIAKWSEITQIYQKSEVAGGEMLCLQFIEIVWRILMYCHWKNNFSFTIYLAKIYRSFSPFIENYWSILENQIFTPFRRMCPAQFSGGCPGSWLWHAVSWNLHAAAESLISDLWHQAVKYSHTFIEKWLYCKTYFSMLLDVFRVLLFV